MGISRSRSSRLLRQMAMGPIVGALLIVFGGGYAKTTANGGRSGAVKSKLAQTAAPQVLGVNPTAGSSTATSTIVVSGQNFVAGAMVTVGGVPATRQNVINEFFVGADIPPQSPGPVDIQVTNPDGQTSTLTGAFTFLTPGQPFIGAVKIKGKNLQVFPGFFDAGSTIILNGTDQKTVADTSGIEPVLIGKKVGREIAVGQTVMLQVRNTAGLVSPEFQFTRIK